METKVLNMRAMTRQEHEATHRTGAMPRSVRRVMRENRYLRRATICAVAAMLAIMALAALDVYQSRSVYKQMAAAAEQRVAAAEQSKRIYQTVAERWEEMATEQRAVDVEYLGEFLCTAYCGEKYEHICGTGDGITASGAPVVSGVTCAAPENIPFGTVLYIEGVGFRVVQDRGSAIADQRLDVATDTHAEALGWAGYGMHRVFIVQAPGTGVTE